MIKNVLFSYKLLAKLQKYLHISKKKSNFADYFTPKITFYYIVMEKIDELDRKILRIITQNARIPFKDVAEQCGVSRAAVHQRVQKMFDTGVIVGSGYQVNPKMLGYNLCALVGILLERGTMYQRVIEELNTIPEVVDAYYTLGAYSMMIKLHAKDDKHLMSLLTKLQEVPGVAKTETLTALEQQIGRMLPID